MSQKNVIMYLRHITNVYYTVGRSHIHCISAIMIRNIFIHVAIVIIKYIYYDTAVIFKKKTFNERVSDTESSQ